MNNGQLQLEPGNLKLISGVVAIAFYAWRRNMLQTIVFGMAFFTLLRLMHVFS